MPLAKSLMRHGEEYRELSSGRVAYWDANRELFVVYKEYYLQHLDDKHGNWFFSPDQATGETLEHKIPKEDKS